MLNGIHWCDDCNVPIIGEKCENCFKEANFVALSRAADARPAFENDIRLIKSLLREWIGQPALKKLDMERKIVLLNRLPYLDKAYEVLIDGKILCHVFFDLYTFKWKVKPLKPLCSLIIEENLEKIAFVNKEKVSKGEILNSTDFKYNAGESEDLVCLFSRDEKSLGLGFLTDNKIIVLKAWSPSKPYYNFGKKASFKDAIKANKLSIEHFESRACSFLERYVNRFKRKTIISYSGGKDSLICLLLSLKTGINAKLLFTNTCLEMPETLKNVKRVVEALEIDVIKAEADCTEFWSKAEEVGPPARDFRWCSQVCKLKPTKKVLASFGETLCIVGQRKAESLKRASSQAVWKNRYLPNVINITPIQNWKALLIWLYLIKNRKENLVNELYFKGFDRVGCYMCPSATIADFKMVKEWHPELWEKWEVFLQKWKKRNNLEDTWLTYALWRWKRRTPKGIRNFLGKSSIKTVF